jgi:hypothetical protein
MQFIREAIVTSVKKALYIGLEYNTGKLLLKAIRMDDEFTFKKAVDTAKKELQEQARNDIEKEHDEDFETMNERMIQYLTRPYDIGEGILGKCTPDQFCVKNEASSVKLRLRDLLRELQVQNS